MPSSSRAVLDRIAAGVAAVAAALRFLTRLPVPRLGPADDPAAPPPFPAIAWALPVAGAVIGAIGAAVLVVAGLALPPLAAAVVAVAAGVAITGALHEDGFADALDALGGRTRERRLEIMRDSRIGTFGAAGLALALMLRVALLSALLAEPAFAAAVLVAGATLARAGSVGILAALPPARRDGLGAAASGIAPRTTITAIAVAAVLGLAALIAAGHPGAAVAALAAAGTAGLGMIGLARRLLGGQTGDVAGATAVAVDLAVLLAATAAAGTV